LTHSSALLPPYATSKEVRPLTLLQRSLTRCTSRLSSSQFSSSTSHRIAPAHSLIGAEAKSTAKRFFNHDRKSARARVLRSSFGSTVLYCTCKPRLYPPLSSPFSLPLHLARFFFHSSHPFPLLSSPHRSHLSLHAGCHPHHSRHPLSTRSSTFNPLIHTWIPK